MKRTRMVGRGSVRTGASRPTLEKRMNPTISERNERFFDGSGSVMELMLRTFWALPLAAVRL